MIAKTWFGPLTKKKNCLAAIDFCRASYFTATACFIFSVTRNNRYRNICDYRNLVLSAIFEVRYFFSVILAMPHGLQFRQLSSNHSVKHSYFSLSINLCLKIFKITYVIKWHFSSERIMDYYLRKFEYAMENVRYSRGYINS